MLCEYCGLVVVKRVGKQGRVKRFCSDAHRQAAYRLRKNDYVRQHISPQLNEIMWRRRSQL